MAKKHDVILFYGKTNKYRFNPLKEKSYISHKYGFSNIEILKDETGYYTMVGMRDYWNIPALRGNQSEATSYPTQKPLKLLERVIQASSNEGDIVFDPFCGCATTCVAAEELNRKWIGIDISPIAGKLVVNRIKNLGLFSQDIIHRKDIPQRTDLGKIPKYNSPVNRTKLYGEQSGDCNGCKTHFQTRHLEIDHIIAKSKGGTDHIENLQLLCGSCNRIKGDRGMEYLMAALKQ